VGRLSRPDRSASE